MSLFDKLKSAGTKLVDNYTYRGSVRGSSIQYSTSEILGYGDGKGSAENESIIKSISDKSSKLHKEASIGNKPELKSILNANSYTYKYHNSSLNPIIPNASNIDEGSKAPFIAPSSPSIKGRNINVRANSIPSYSSINSYQSQFEKYKAIDPNINSKF